MSGYSQSRVSGILTALALDLDEDGEVGGGLAIPRCEGLQDLETLRLGVNGNLDGGAVFRRSLVSILSWVVAPGGKTQAGGLLELELGTIRSGKLVSLCRVRKRSLR